MENDMGKFVLVNVVDSNNRIELESKTTSAAYREALDILGWHILSPRLKEFHSYNKNKEQIKNED